MPPQILRRKTNATKQTIAIFLGLDFPMRNRSTVPLRKLALEVQLQYTHKTLKKNFL